MHRKEILNIDDRACGLNSTFKAGQAATSERVSLLIRCVCPLRTTATMAYSRLGSIGHSLWSQELDHSIIGVNTIQMKLRSQLYTKYIRNVPKYHQPCVCYCSILQHLRQEYKGDKKRHRGKGWCPPIHAEYEGFMEEESMD